MKKNHAVEKEFGVPFAGKILDPPHWTKTALKKLPAEGPLDVAGLFGRTAPLVVDLGCGNGRFMIASAVRRPEVDHIGIDILPLVLRYATRRGNQRGLSNLRLAAIDAQTFVAKYLTPASVRELHCYHPQPYHDPRDAHKRLIAPAFLAAAHRVLAPGGTFHVQTDNQAYWQYMQAIMPTFFDFHIQPGPWPDDPRGRTRREIIALKRGYAVYRGWGVVRADRPSAQMLEAAQTLPAPTFDAGRRDPELDRLELS